MDYTAQRNFALKERNERVMRERLIYIRKKSRIKKFFRTNIVVEVKDNNFNIDFINKTINDVDEADIGKPKSDYDLEYCQKISDELFLRLATHFVDSDIKITTTESSGSAITTHYRNHKPNLVIKI